MRGVARVTSPISAAGGAARVRLRHRRRRLGRLRAREPAVRRPGVPRAAARGRRRDARNFWLRLPVGYFRTIYDPRFSWQFPLEPEASDRQPRDRLAARQGARRLERHQRPDLHPRPARRLRRLGKRARRARLGLSRGAAVLQALRALRRRRERVPRRARRARRLRPAQRPSVLRGVARRGRRGRPAAHRRLQRRTTGRPRPLPAHAARPLALRRGERVPRAGAAARRTSRSRPARTSRASSSSAAARPASSGSRPANGEARAPTAR